MKINRFGLPAMKPQQIQFIKTMIRQKLIANQPVLLICKDDQQSALLYEAISTDSELMRLMNKCNRVHGLTEKVNEIKAIEEAGAEGVVTISTVGMLGRV